MYKELRYGKFLEQSGAKFTEMETSIKFQQTCKLTFCNSVTTHRLKNYGKEKGFRGTRTLVKLITLQSV